LHDLGAGFDGVRPTAPHPGRGSRELSAATLLVSHNVPPGNPEDLLRRDMRHFEPRVLAVCSAAAAWSAASALWFESVSRAAASRYRSATFDQYAASAPSGATICIT